MGSGKNGTFDIHPDLQQWAIMIFWKADKPIEESAIINGIQELLGNFIMSWLGFFKAELKAFQLQPYAGHGSWDGETFIDQRQKKEDPDTSIAVLTRATIRFIRLKNFWNAVPSTAMDLSKTKGLIYSIGIGEVPFIKQATFSIWERAEDMKNFAYKKAEHRQVIQETRKESWYAEELFLRFHVIGKYTIGKMSRKDINARS